MQVLQRWPTGSWTVSGRAALTQLLASKRPVFSRIQLPAFICSSVIDAVEAAGFEYSFFDVDEGLQGTPHADPTSLALQIHYFGAVTKWDCNALGVGGIIEDFSMAVPALRHGEALDNDAFFSARKFGPVPLGGWASVKLTLTPRPAAKETERVSLQARQDKGLYLKDRGATLDANVEASYLDRLRWAERELAKLPSDCALPPSSRQLFNSLDWDSIGRQRRSNWQQLTAGLHGQFEILNPFLGPSVGTVPLGLVLKIASGRDRLRSALMQDRLFCPVHWPLPAQIKAQEFPRAARLCATVITIPLDQRYSSTDMEFVIECLSRRGRDL